MTELYTDYAHTIVFVHVISAFIWVGGMIAIRFAVHPTMQSIDDARIKLGKTLMLVGKFFHIVIPFIVVIFITGLIMAVAQQGHHGEQKMIFLFKESIWAVMAVNFSWMYLKRRNAQKRFDAGDLPGAKAMMALIPQLLLPINILLGLAALWTGIALRGL
ncbi:hypothetical protein [Sulfurovum sp.]|jgi:uncharacterized membrane protein|uniref:hypothetical protein n=1 Tax=Sulfurovum sp. TaxID=1969726 RepID=UPI002A3672CC|nr:hypothetical protein [Sulfurovum sp.]MDY0404013.1 hypothetical protein [Sulfurovum sp.]